MNIPFIPKKYIAMLALVLVIVSSLAIFAMPQQAMAVSSPTGDQAGGTVGNAPNSTFLGWPNLIDLVSTVVGWGMQIALAAGGLLVTMSAGVLNVSIVATLHIKDFVEATPAIYTIWQTIRDITGIFFIFFLLYAAIQIILGEETSKGYGTLIKNIVVFGILINFSFFITSVLIDASNITSQALYNAILPNNPQKTQSVVNMNLAELSKQVNGTGASTENISTIFMNSLKIQQLYNTNGNGIGAVITTPFKIILIGVAGTAMMITTAASFMLASLAFIARLVILIFLLAFSPLWFAASLIPEIKKKFDFWGYLKPQLIFMPVYLLLLYVALSILNSTDLIGAANASFNTSSTTVNWVFPFVVLGINFAVVIIMLNLPLYIGLKMGGEATDWLKTGMGKWDAKTIWKNVGGWTGRNTVGKAASSLGRSSAFGRLASVSPSAGILASKGLSKVSSASFGGTKGGFDAQLKKDKSAIKDVNKRLEEIDKRRFKNEEERNSARADGTRIFGESFRSNLAAPIPLLSEKNIFNRMVASRARRESASELNKDVKKNADKEAKKRAQKELKDLTKEESELNKVSSLVLPGRLGDEIQRNKQIRLEQIAKRKEELQEDIDKGTAAENEERDSKFMSKLEDIDKKAEKASGGDKA